VLGKHGDDALEPFGLQKNGRAVFAHYLILDKDCTTTGVRNQNEQLPNLPPPLKRLFLKTAIKRIDLLEKKYNH